MCINIFACNSRRLRLPLICAIDLCQNRFTIDSFLNIATCLFNVSLEIMDIGF